MGVTLAEAKVGPRAFPRRQELSRKNLSEQARFWHPEAGVEPCRPLDRRGRPPAFQTAPNEKPCKQWLSAFAITATVTVLCKH
jgi:hypothetical protein